MADSFRIRDIEVKKGTKSDGYLIIQDDDAGNVKLLIGIVNGLGSGPVLCLTGGMYGTIYPGIDACIELFKTLDPQELRGTVITVPVIEMTGFQQCRDVSPVDGLNPNKVFPGDPHGTISHRIAYVVLNEIVKRSDYHLDLRGGDAREQLHTFAISCQTGNSEFDAKTEKLARMLGTRYYSVFPISKGSLLAEANRIGIPSVVLEASRGLSSYDEDDVQTNLKAILNLMKYLGMTNGSPDIPSDQKKELFQRSALKAQQGGILYLDCELGERAVKGQKLGEIRNLRGEIVQELVAPIHGLVHLIFPSHVKKPGETVIVMQPVVE